MSPDFPSRQCTINTQGLEFIKLADISKCKLMSSYTILTVTIKVYHNQYQDKIILVLNDDYVLDTIDYDPLFDLELIPYEQGILVQSSSHHYNLYFQ
jgi:hypothetical protein